MMRKVIALFDEYQSKENAKHVIRSMKENARQGFWNGATPPLGYRLIEAEKRGAKIKKSSKSIRSRRKRYGSVQVVPSRGRQLGRAWCEGKRQMA
jgi:DNA invertase Pin-like site-specific DNA recombinase